MPRIRPAQHAELARLRAIEREAGRAFAAAGMPDIAADEPPSVAELEAFRARGRAWVAVDSNDREPCYKRLGFVIVGPADQGPELAALGPDGQEGWEEVADYGPTGRPSTRERTRPPEKMPPAADDARAPAAAGPDRLLLPAGRSAGCRAPA